MSRYFIFLLGCILVTLACKAQPAQLLLPFQKTAIHRYLIPVHNTAFLIPVKDTTASLPATTYLPPNFYTAHFGVACKLELQLEKQTKLPIRIRLGSKDQVDYLEGKYNRHL